MVIPHHSSATFGVERSNCCYRSSELVQYWLETQGRDKGLALLLSRR